MKSFVVSIIVVVGLVSLWVGERIVETGTLQMAASGLGVALILVACVIRVMRLMRAPAADFKHVERSLLLLHLLALFATALYFVQSDAFAKLATQRLESTSPKLSGVLSVLWPALMLGSLAPTALIELASAAMARAPKLELERIRGASHAGWGFAFAVIFSFAMQYVVTERDVKRDFSYFRMARPGDATKRLVQSFDEKIEVALFYPPASDVAEYVEAYFDELKQEAPMITVARFDHALEPVKAKEYGVTGNGTVVVRKGARKEALSTGTEVEKSRTQLRSLDQEMQKRFLQVGKARRTVYLTAGHGERTQDSLGGADQRGTIDMLYRTLQEQNFEVKVLSSAEGLGNDVPHDAAAVFVIGPQRAFNEAEASTLANYEARGGKVFMALDPENGLAFAELLKPLGLSFKPEVLASDTSYARLKQTYSPSDRRNIATRTYSSHPSVSSLSRSQLPCLVLGVGALDELPAHEAGLAIDFAMKAAPSTWNDVNPNFEPDAPDEVRKAYTLMAAVNKRGTSNKIEDEMRVLVLGDSDAVTDAVLNAVQGNAYLVVDGLKWLLGEEQLQGTTNSEQDIAMTRTKEQDGFWFYGTTLLAPAAVLGVGLLARRRPKKKGATS